MGQLLGYESLTVDPQVCVVCGQQRGPNKGRLWFNFPLGYDSAFTSLLFSYKPGSDEKTSSFLWTVFIAEDFWVNWLIDFVCYPSPVFKTVWLPFNHVTNRAKTVTTINWFVLSSGLVCPGRSSRNVVKSDPLLIISDMAVSQINCKWMVRCIICSTVSIK